MNKNFVIHFGQLPRTPPWTDLHEIWHRGRVPDVSTVTFFSQSLKW